MKVFFENQGQHIKPVQWCLKHIEECLGKQCKARRRKNWRKKDEQAEGVKRPWNSEKTLKKAYRGFLIADLLKSTT